MTDERAAAPVRVLMAAIGGYGYHYLKTLLDEVPAGRATLAGVVDPFAKESAAWPSVSALGVPVVDEVEAYFAAGHRADLVVVSSPIQFHVEQSVAALAAGSHVLCDKPLGATVPDVDRLAGARDRAGRFVMVGYQWSFSTAIQSLKRDLLAGRYGRPLRLATLCAWPRDAAYYRRNSWAGRLRDAATGAWVLDSPANNAMAHFLHNALFVVGPDMARSALPAAVTAELARAYPIESADTAACRVLTEGGCEVLFLASHATGEPIEPRFRLECEGGVIVYGERDRHVVGTTEDGRVTDYGDPDATHQFRKLFAAIDHVRSPAGDILCGVETAAAQTACVVAMHESAPDIVRFPAMLRRGHPDDRVHVVRLEDELLRCYDAWVLPSEIGCPWAAPGRRVLPTLPSAFLDTGPAVSPVPGRSAT
ncbi:MAG: Gfo/Idh/MocA family oxidoreductase [Vicinamibacterales bacterium]